jgi:hypothetical protein
VRARGLHPLVSCFVIKKTYIFIDRLLVYAVDCSEYSCQKAFVTN